MFQRELLHFITVMDDYFMSRATYIECNKFTEALLKMRTQNSTISDLDDIIEVHDAHMAKVIQLCLMDPKSKELLRYIMDIVEISQEFRKLIKMYLLTNSDAFASDDSASDNFSDSSNNRVDKFEGMGILLFASQSFTQDLSEC
jgi:hypothetical protein